MALARWRPAAEHRPAMARLSLAPVALQPAAGPPPPGAASARQVQLAWDDGTAAAPWLQALAAEGITVRGAAIDTVNTAALPDAALLHLSHGLPPQLPRLRELRAAWPRLPLVVVCRALRDLDHVLALEMGADDVFDATLAAPVVAARLRALWRRCQGAGEAAASAAVAPTELRFGALELSLTARRALLAGAAVDLTEGEFELLWLLASHAGRTLARRDILKSVRGLTDHPTDRSIDSRVYRLRAKLGDAAQQRIRTVRHRGYLFSALPW